MTTFSPLILSAIFALAASQASAETYARTVPANRATIVGSFAGYNSATCGSIGLPDAKVRTPPQFGTLRIETRMGKVASENRCKGTDQQFLVFVYTPRQGFKGQDLVKVDIPWRVYVDNAQFTVLTDTYELTVQ